MSVVPPVLTRTWMINVNEVFGPTIQGEGPHTGRRSTFLRVAGCNLACSWCDTPYSWDWQRYERKDETHPMTPAELAADIQGRGADLLVVTGGEPTLQQPGLLGLFGELPGSVDVAIETNGTRVPGRDFADNVTLFVVSPKLANGGDKLGARIVPKAMAAYRDLAVVGKAAFKFVVASVEDLDEVAALCDLYRIEPPAVWAMPLGATAMEHLANLADLADPIVEHGFNLSTRMHVLAWGTERGR